jgi:hypothetical protein
MNHHQTAGDRLAWLLHLAIAAGVTVAVGSARLLRHARQQLSRAGRP